MKRKALAVKNKALKEASKKRISKKMKRKALAVKNKALKEA